MWNFHANNGRPAQLYDLENDVGENHEVIGSNPEVVEVLDGHRTAFSKDINDNRRRAAFEMTADGAKHE